MERIICVAIGYLFGLLQTGYLYGKTQHVDIRKEGSGNAGTTNALRTMGWKAGAITFLGDCFKCVLAVAATYFIYGKTQADIWPLLMMYTGAGVILGHNFPFYMKFKGGNCGDSRTYHQHLKSSDGACLSRGVCGNRRGDTLRVSRFSCDCSYIPR